MSSTEHTAGIFTTDANLTIRSWDSWLSAATGIPAEAARGKMLVALFPELEARGMIGRFERVLAKGVVEVLAPTFHHYLIPCAPTGPSKHFDKMQQRVTIAPLRENESIVGTIVTVEDVTARLDHERELAEQLESKDEPTRLRAAQVLAEEDALSSAQKLAGSLGDESWRVRRTVVDSLARQAGEDEVKILLRALRDEHRDPATLNSALQVLALSGVDAISPLAEFLKDPDVDLRIYATHALGDQHDPRAVPVLIGALGDENVNVRYHAIEALGKLRAVEAVDALAGIAESRDFFLAFPALDALTVIGEARVAPRLVPLLEDEALSSPATEALGRLGDEDVVAPLVELLNAPGANAQVIAQALARLYDRYEKLYQEGTYIADLARGAVNEPGVRNLLDAIEHVSGDTLRSLALVLGWLKGEAVERALARLLGQSTARKEVVEALVRHGERVTQLLIEQLQAEEVETRKAAIIALGRIGDPGAVPVLVQSLTDGGELSVVAAGALGKIGDRRAFVALLDLIGHPDAAVRQAAIAAINSLGHPEMAARAMRLLDDPDPLVRESAVKIAGYFGYAECADLLLDRCRDEEEGVRRAAVEHLPYLEDGRVVPALVDAIENGTPRVRAAAANAFGQVESAVALPHLLAALSDPDPWVRYFATRSIGRHRYTESLDALTRMAQTDDASHVRIAAVDSLGKVDDPRAANVLASLVESSDVDLAGAALRSLGQITHPQALPPLLEALRSPDAARRRGALQALGAVGGEDAVKAMQWTAAADVDASVAQAAIDALASLATPEAIDALIGLTAEKSRREASVVALSGLDKDKIELIGRGLTQTQSVVRRAVVDALGRMKHPLASELLGGALDDEEVTVRLAAVNALAHLGNRAAERKLLSLMRTDPDTAVGR
ncbi:MAG TPA: HEAT repeat domain-containing protein, partial [Blastocatellia bacterium]|nr:HEAT repeat domain-containing protein [Blastocatellia bacterium]